MATQIISELAHCRKHLCPDGWQSEAKRLCKMQPVDALPNPVDLPTPTPTQTGSSPSPIENYPSLRKSTPSVDWDTTSWDANLPDLPFVFGGPTTNHTSATATEPLFDDFTHQPAQGFSKGGDLEESCMRGMDHFPCPKLNVPAPALDFDFRLAVVMKEETAQMQGQHGKVPREISPIRSGSWSGSFGHGKVVAGGYDLGQARGFRPIRIVEGAFIMQTTDEVPAILEMRTRGSLSGPSQVLDALLAPGNAGKDIDSRKYAFRMFMTVKTADKRYAEYVNCGLWVASGVWKGEELVIDAYRAA